jgi:hypothetical protein
MGEARRNTKSATDHSPVFELCIPTAGPATNQPKSQSSTDPSRVLLARRLRTVTPALVTGRARRPRRRTAVVLSHPYACQVIGYAGATSRLALVGLETRRLDPIALV